MRATSEKRLTDRQTSFKPTRIVIGEDPYELVNVSREGIGIQVEDNHSFYLGQRLTAIAIETAAETRYLEGSVTHITHRSANVVCGIRLVLSDIEAYNHMADFIKERSV